VGRGARWTRRWIVRILPVPPSAREPHTSAAADGNVLGCLLKNTPQFIDGCVFSLVDLTDHLSWIDALTCCGIDVLELRGVF
jgi:hypothetical protein